MFFLNLVSAFPKKEVQSRAIQASYKENAPGIMVFSIIIICVDSAKLDTAGQKNNIL